MSNRFRKIVRNVIVCSLLLFLFLMRSGLYLTPLSAHEHSERSIHYGPSKVVHIENFDKGKYILGKYDKWVSYDTVNRRLFFFWGYGNQPTGFENNKNKALDYTWMSSEENCILYGSINDNRIKKVEVTLNDGTILTQTNFYDDLFLFTWKSKSINFIDVKGYDSRNNLIIARSYMGG